VLHLRRGWSWRGVPGVSCVAQAVSGKRGCRVTPQPTQLCRRDRLLILSALWDAKLWQESIADAHTLEPWHQTADLTRTARAATRLARRYMRLHDRMHMETHP